MDLDQVAHVLARAGVRELTLHLLLLHRILLLHLEFDIVEYTVEVDWIQLDRDLDRRVLLEVNKRLLALLWVNHSRRSFYALTLLHRDLLAVEDHQLNETLDHDHAVVGLAGDRIVKQGEVE